MNYEQRTTAGAGRSLRVELGKGSVEQVRDVIEQLLDVSELEQAERVELLASLLVTEALQPYWASGHTAESAHAALGLAQPELAAAIEALAPLLYTRAAITEVERLLGLG